jgi:hypothetical protein
LDKGVQVVQVQLPPTIHFIQDKQLGVLRGITAGTNVDTGNKGWGKCHLIKGVYHYFAIHLEGKAQAKEGDLVYTFIPKPKNTYDGVITRCAAHNITFRSVTDIPLYSPQKLLLKWTVREDEAVLDSMMKDIRYTASYYKKENPAMNKTLEGGRYDGKGMLDAMEATKREDVVAFLDYVAARPIRYAGNTWKISETYATWLVNRAPEVIKN